MIDDYTDVGDGCWQNKILSPKFSFIIQTLEILTFHFRVFDKDTDGVISKQEFIDELKRYL